MSTPASRQYNFVDDKNNAIPITASRVDAEFDNVMTKLNQKVIVSASTPSSPIAGMFWLDSTNKLLKEYRNSEWVTHAAVHLATAAPTTPQTGDIWYDTANDLWYYYNGVSQVAFKDISSLMSVGNMVANGSFERWSAGTSNKAPNDWSLIGAPTDVSRDTGEGDNYGGAYAAKITSAGASAEGVSQTLTNLKPSTTYAISARVKATAHDTAKVWTTGADTDFSETSTSETWATLKGIFITDSTPTNVVIRAGSDNNTDIVWIDCVMVVMGSTAPGFSKQIPSLSRVVQVVNVMSGAVATGNTTMPFDDSIPQNSEGVEWMTLAITPTSATNKLLIEVIANFSWATSVAGFSAALFQDATAGALAAVPMENIYAVDRPFQVILKHYMVTGTTSATTFKFRAGPHTTSVITFNGVASGRLYGGVMASSITITEIAADV